MLSRDTEQQLVQLFIAVSVGEEKINKLKQDILSNYNINPIQFFFKFNNMGCITQDDIYSYLHSFQINFSPVDIDFIFYFYDKDFDSVLNFFEFLDLLISDSNYLYKKSYKKKFRNNKIEPKELNSEIDIDIQKNILQIFIEEINLARNLCGLILNLRNCPDFDIQEVFYEIKSYSYITTDSIKAFFDRNDISYNDIFIKNIFNRFDNKEISGKISFNKFKLFFDLPYGSKNKNKQQNPKNNFNKMRQIINQTQMSSDINLSNCITNNNFNNYNNQRRFNNFEKNICGNSNFENEEDIQFECSHMSRSGSVESKDKNSNNNCKITQAKKKNNNYKNYLREKRSKSLEKSLSRSLSRTSEVSPKQNKLKEYIKNKNNNIHMINNNNNNNDATQNNLSSSTEDIHLDQIKLPARLDKNLVKRSLPTIDKKNIQNYDSMYYTNNCYCSSQMDSDQYSSPSPQNYRGGKIAENDRGNFSNYNNNQRTYHRVHIDRDRNNLDGKLYKEDMRIRGEKNMDYNQKSVSVNNMSRDYELQS